MEYGRFVVLGYSSYRVDMVRRSPTEDQDTAPPSFGLTDTSDEASLSRKRSLGQLWKPLGDQNAHYVLKKRARANGVRLHRFHHIFPIPERNHLKHRAIDLKDVTTRMMQRIEASRTIHKLSEGNGNVSYQMCVPMNDHDPFASITEFKADPNFDMFQIGRMPCAQNDFVIPGPRVGASGTISRYAARILCSREPPFECRIFAGGFDASRRMSTAGHALKHCAHCGVWAKRLAIDHTCVEKTIMQKASNEEKARDKKDTCQVLHKVQHYIDETREDGALEHLEIDLQDGHNLPMDGLTKNGVRVWLPAQKQWFEVSVNGRLYAIDSRTVDASLNLTSDRRHRDVTLQSRSGAFNRPASTAEESLPILTDGAVIDLGGVHLQFQTTYRSGKVEKQKDWEAPIVYGRATLSSISTQLDRLNVQCPVQLHSLRFTRTALNENVPLNQIPHVFAACGHVFGYEKRMASTHTCPLCRTPGSLVQLLLKENSQLQSTEEQRAIPECVFNPCGHAISSKLAHYYSTLLMPNGRAICPFCAVHLDLRVPFSRLYLYCEESE